MIHSCVVLTCGTLLLITSGNLATAGRAQENDNCIAPALICLASHNQDLSAQLRDRSRYEQNLIVDRYKREKFGLSIGRLESHRETTAIVQPSVDPDETGQYPVLTRVIGDTDDEGRPKSKVDPNARTALGAGVFLDLVFFPLLPERRDDYQYEEIVTNKPGERIYRFIPRTDTLSKPLATGTVQVDATTGEVLTMKIEGLRNLEALDKAFKGLQRFMATIDYSQFDGKYRMPTLASGSGESDISRFKGIFKFRYRESKYIRVLETSR